MALAVRRYEEEYKYARQDEKDAERLHKITENYQNYSVFFDKPEYV